jgi:cell division protein FtsQ
MEKEKIIDLGDRMPKLKEELRKKANYRLIFYIFFFFFVMMLVLYFQSAFSDVSQVKVDGNQYVTEEEIIELAEITSETSYWKISEEEVETKIKKHNEIDSVTVTKKFPNSVSIHVKEYGTVGYLVKDSKYHPVLENGRILDSIDEGVFPVQAPLLHNFVQGNEEDQQDQKDKLQELAVEMSLLPESIRKSISEIYYTPRQGDPFHLKLYMSEEFEVSVNIKNFAENMMLYPSVATQENRNRKGIFRLDATNTKKGHDKVVFEPYDSAE